MTEHTASYPFPVLGMDRMDYADSCRYSTSEWSIMSREVGLLHRVEGDSLVSEMLRQGSAQFGCVVVLRATMYREISLCGANKNLSVRQKLTLPEGYRSVEVPKFMPVVVYMKDGESIKAGKNHGVHEFWHGQKFNLYKGAILARDTWRSAKVGAGHLLRIQPQDGIPDGSITVEAVTSGSGYFLVRVSPDFDKSMDKVALQGEDKNLHIRSVVTHALSAGLVRLAALYKEGNNLDVYENFQALKQDLESKEESTWEDGDDFDPCRAACVYQPHCLDLKSNQEDDDDNE